MKLTSCGVLRVLAASGAAASSPTAVIWASSPVLANETALLRTPLGAGFSDGTNLLLCGDGESSCEPIDLAVSDEDSAAMFVVPANLSLATWKVKDASTKANIATLNRPELWWSICHDSAALGCRPGSTIRVFGRSLAFGPSSCLDYSHREGSQAATIQLTPSSSGAPIVLRSFEASCYSASFSLPESLLPGAYEIKVSNNLRGSEFSGPSDVYNGDLGQSTIEIALDPPPKPTNATITVAAGDVPGLKAALARFRGAAADAGGGAAADAGGGGGAAADAGGGGTVQLSAGAWHMARLDRLFVPDGVTLRGSGMGSTRLVWPQQDGKACVETGWPTKRVALIQGGAARKGQESSAGSSGWMMQDLTVLVDDGFAQNDTKAFCSAVQPCVSGSYGCPDTSMSLLRVNVSVVAKEGGVDMFSGGVGVGPAVSIFGKHHALLDSVVSHFGDCGSNVSPMLQMAGDRIVVANNTFRFGCTLQSARSVTQLLWEGNTATHLTDLGRDGSVYATFGAPFRVEHVAFLGNRQTDTAVTPPGAAASRSAHRLEGLTLDGGGGAYTGGVAKAFGRAVTFAQRPFGNGTGSYSPAAVRAKANWTGAALMVLAGRGAGQWQRVAASTMAAGSFDGLEWGVTRDWVVPPDATSTVQVAPLRGHLTLVGNTWTTAYTVQLYGATECMCLDTVVAENVFDTTPFYVWGRNPHYWGYQPNWQVEVISNKVLSSRGITTLSCDQKFNLCNEGMNPAVPPYSFNGPLNSAVVIRRNILRDGQGITIHGTTHDAVVESNFIQNGSGGFMKDPIQVDNRSTANIEIRNNTANA